MVVKRWIGELSLGHTAATFEGTSRLTYAAVATEIKAPFLNTADANTDPIDPVIGQALAALRRGELVAMPTETVYGLAADAHNPAAVAAVYALKGRPLGHPLIIHLGEVSWLARYADPLPPIARALAKRYWPGPLTLVVPAAASVDRQITGGADTVALRMPNHPLALALLRGLGHGLVAPSANRYGSISPTSAADVRAEFGEQAPLIIDGGRCQSGIESTIVDCTVDPPRLLRPGTLQLAELSELLPDHLGPRAPGRVDRHYAPRTPAYRVPAERWAQVLRSPPAANVQALSWAPLPEGVAGVCLGDEPIAYARELYRSLRQLDRAGADCILVQEVPADAAWMAVADRLSRATLPLPADAA